MAARRGQGNPAPTNYEYQFVQHALPQEWQNRYDPHHSKLLIEVYL